MNIKQRLRAWLGISENSRPAIADLTPSIDLINERLKSLERQRREDTTIYYEDRRLTVVMGQFDNLQRSISEALQKQDVIAEALGIVVTVDVEGAVVCSLNQDKDWCREYVKAARQNVAAINAQTHWLTLQRAAELARAEEIKAGVMARKPR